MTDPERDNVTDGDTVAVPEEVNDAVVDNDAVSDSVDVTLAEDDTLGMADDEREAV